MTLRVLAILALALVSSCPDLPTDILLTSNPTSAIMLCYFFFTTVAKTPSTRQHGALLTSTAVKRKAHEDDDVMSVSASISALSTGLSLSALSPSQN